MLHQLIADIESFGTALRRGRSANVNDQSSKDRAITLASAYFAEVRPSLWQGMGTAHSIPVHDERWQQLVRLAHGNNARRTYVRTIAEIRRELIEYRVAALVGSG